MDQSIYGTPNPQNPFELSAKVSEFGGQEEVDPGDPTSEFAYGGSSLGNLEPYIAVDPEWVKQGIVEPGDRVPIWNPDDPSKVAYGVVRDKGPARWTGRGIDMAPNLLKDLNLATDQVAHFDFSKKIAGGQIAAPATEDLTTAEGASAYAARALQDPFGKQAAAGQKAGAQSTDEHGQPIKSSAPNAPSLLRYPDGSVEIEGTGMRRFPSGIIQNRSGQSITEAIPDPTNPSGYRIHTFQVKPSENFQIISDTNTGQHYRVDKNTGKSEEIVLPKHEWGIPTGVTGEEALSGQDPKDALVAKKMANYELAPPTGFALRSPYWAKMLALASAYDPSYNSQNYKAQMAVRQQFTSGKYSQTRGSLNTLVSHLAELDDAARKMGNVDFTPYNTLANWLITKRGDPRATNFQKASTAVENELATVFKGTGATDQEIKQWRVNLDSSQSPRQMQDGINELLRLVGGRLDTMHFIYTTGVGKTANFPMMSEKARNILRSRFGAEGAALSDMDASGEGTPVPQAANVPEGTRTLPIGSTVDVGGKPMVVGKPYYDPGSNETKTLVGLDAQGQPVWSD